jgi:trichohyalin
LRHQKLKESHDTKEYLASKLRSLDENMKLIENNDYTKMDLTVQGGDMVEENVRKSKIREIKQAKELLEKKLVNIDEHIQSLISEENNTMKQAKKFDLKQYLENFEKDKKEAEEKVRELHKDKDEIKKKLEEQTMRDERKRKQRLEQTEKEREERETKKHEDYLKKLELMKLKTKDKHEEVEKLKDEWKGNKITVERNYKYLTAEEDFKQRQQQVEEERKNKFTTDIMKKRSTYLKPINKEELDEFSKKVMEERQRKMYEKEKERLLKQEELMNINANLPRSDTNAYKQIIEEDKKFKNMKEKDKLDKLYNLLKVKNYSKEVKESMLPDIDESKKKEREERIDNLANPKVQKLKRKRGNRVLLIKPKGKDGREHNTSQSHRSLNVSKHSIIRSSHSLDESEKYDYNELKKRLYKSKSRGERKPLEKVPDYLTEMRRLKEKKTGGVIEPQIQTSKVLLIYRNREEMGKDD